MSITEDSKLADLPLPHLDVVLEELFLIAPQSLFPTKAPLTVKELAHRTRRPVVDVIAGLERSLLMSQDIEIDCDELSALLTAKGAGPADEPILLDVREPWEFEICKIPGSLLLAELSLQELLPRLQAAKLVVTICHHGIRSYSAAMFLRQNAVAGARSLAGGVEDWSRQVDPAMPRY